MGAAPGKSTHTPRAFGPRSRGLQALGLVAGLCVGAGLVPGCYTDAGGGQPPPTAQFYFPVALAVSRGGNVLYAVNSDFDLQWNGGTLQAYDLHLIRKHAVAAIADPRDPMLPVPKEFLPPPNACPGNPPAARPDGSGRAQPSGWTCVPPTDAAFYERDSVIVGAFATDLRLALGGSRLFAPIRGDASLTWANVAPDDPGVAPTQDATAETYAPFRIDCGTRTSDGRCDQAHHAGDDPNEPGNTRNITMPGEPFGIALTEDGTGLIVTHQTDTKTSLFSTGNGGPAGDTPALQYVLDGLPTGGIAAAAIPHDPLAYPECIASVDSPACAAAMPREAFLQTSRAVAAVSLIRYYSDDGTFSAGSTGTTSAPYRPYLINEANAAITAQAGGTDSRGIVIDPTPRIRCEAAVPAADPFATPPRTQADVDADILACARRPARVFIASRSPAALLYGEVGDRSSTDGTYDADSFRISGNVPLPAGPSQVYLAPIVDATGHYALRIFAVCYDASQIIVLDPDGGPDGPSLESVIDVGPGPFGMAFDPFDMHDVALHAEVPIDTRDPSLLLRRYRFAYVASFTQSYVQVVDLDGARPDKSTYATVVYKVGVPTAPKGS